MEALTDDGDKRKESKHNFARSGIDVPYMMVDKPRPKWAVYSQDSQQEIRFSRSKFYNMNRELNEAAETHYAFGRI